MEMNEEMCIEVDEHNKKIGLRSRSEFKSGKYIHRSAHLLLFNSKREIVLQKRAPDKRVYPNQYTYSVSGAVANETPRECIEREMQEEIGISVPCTEILTYKNFDEIEKTFNTLFEATSDEELKPDAREMTKLKWITLEELRDDLQKNPEAYTPSMHNGMKAYFARYCNN